MRRRPLTGSQRLEVAAASLVWAVLVVALSVIMLTIPRFTAVLVDVLGVAEEAGLSPEEARDLAESVRAFVSSSDADSLPATHRGREAFGEQAVEHLLDVRAAIRATRLIAGLAAMFLVVWVVAGMARGHRVVLARGVESGGWTALTFVGAGGLFALVSFRAAFALFHWMLFESGAWLFPADSLLIRLFPEGFWMSSGVGVAALSALGGAALVLMGRRLRKRTPDDGEGQSRPDQPDLGDMRPGGTALS